ncbi:hypothetical protein L1049_011838 [Liquidambar formosana]|uniref:Uncharacterized protein n=1 Tax=Liquidambar formosana TaxID=63359 RepID=A0AAP0RSW4_LIQFO
MNSSSSTADPHPTPTPTPTPTTTTTTTTTTRPLTNPPQQPSRPLTPVPQTHPYPSQPPLFTVQPHLSSSTNTRPSNPNPPPSTHFPKPHDTHPPQGILYPVASSGRGFIPKPIRPQPTDQIVTVANPGAAFPPRSIVTFPHHQVRHFGFSNSDSLNHPVHMMRSPYLQHSHLGMAGSAGSAPIKGIPVSAHPKVASSPSSNSDFNGYKDMRDRIRDDAFVTVEGRKVRISDGSSLYALCRSWLRNGFHGESQPQYGDSAKSLPRPLPIPVADTHLPNKKEGEDEGEEEEGEGSVEHLSAQDLLQRHVKRAKRVRARLREVRLQRIARYKTRLATLLPPPAEQFRDDTAAGN